MSINITDGKKYLGEYSNNGYEDICNWLKKYGKEFSKEFSEQGYTESPLQLMEEIKLIKNKSKEYRLNKDEIKNSVDLFLRLLEQCDIVLIANDGTE